MSASHKLSISLFAMYEYLRNNSCHIEQSRAQTVLQLGEELCVPDISTLLARFLFEQQPKDDNATQLDPINPSEHDYPRYEGKIKVFNSASALFYAPLDASGIHGMRQEIIRSTPNWRNAGARYDCAFVNANPESAPMNGLEVARILAFFSFYFRGTHYPCALVHWFDRVGDKPDKDTGMWLVHPQFNQQHQRKVSIIHIDTIYRAAHLVPVYGKHFVPPHLRPHHSYDSFRLFYVNKFIDHHAFEIVS